MPRALPLLVLLILAPCLQAGPTTDFRPDPRTVQRFGPAYRYPQAGWWVLHVEGEPYQRGYQHGRLMAAEIAGYIRCFAATQSQKDPSNGWALTRTLVNALFLRRFDAEYLEEMKGIADGATDAGAKFDNRPVDVIDVAALNCWAEVETLDGALEALPTGLEGKRFVKEPPHRMPEPPEGHCSAFIATGPATADGKIVFGHITMFGLYPANFFNVWLDVKPAKGHRIGMQSFPGGIHSAMDYYLNSAGLLVAETTIRQTRFNPNGLSLASRIRKALQYSDSIDGVAKTLTTDNNGLYTNEWLIGDTKTNEIAMLQLGTATHRLYRSSRNEWVGGTDGFYWGCNNTKDLALRLETIASPSGRPHNLVWRPSDRDRAWVAFYKQYRGKIDADFARLTFTSGPLAATSSLDAKFTTTDLAKQFRTHALYGPPLGRTWTPTEFERTAYPEIRPLVSHPWTILHGEPPTASPISVDGRVIDLLPKITDRPGGTGTYGGSPPTRPAWHGTILPQSDADAWLAAAFAEFEKVVATENALRENSGGKLHPADRYVLALLRHNYRCDALSAQGHPNHRICPAAYKNFHDDDCGYRQALGRGVWALVTLRNQLGSERFDRAMDAFGRAHAGREVTTADFEAHLERAAGKSLKETFDYWIRGTELPRVRFEQLGVEPDPSGHMVTGTLHASGLTGRDLEILVRTNTSEVLQSVRITGPETRFVVRTGEAPIQVAADPYGELLCAGDTRFSVGSFRRDLRKSLIVFGTLGDEAGNREAARELQRTMRRGPNITVPIKSDQELSAGELASHHLLLVGGSTTNALAARFAGQFPVQFGPGTIRYRTEVFAHPSSSVVASGANPSAPDLTLVVIAGNGAAATYAAATKFTGLLGHAADVVMMPYQGGTRYILAPRGQVLPK
jgi:hypothetical protein